MSDHDPFSSVSADARWAAIAHVLYGEATAAEREALERHLAHHPERAALVDALHATLGVAGGAAADLQMEAALASVKSRREPGAPTLGVLPGGQRGGATLRRRFAGPRLLAAAAAVLLAIGAGLAGNAGWLQTPAPQRFATAVGTRTPLRLSDGTRVVLGPGSELTVPRSYGSGERAVRLRGEGYFQVVHDQAHPFTVTTAGTVLRDVGTTFSVSSDAEQGAWIAVTEGAVSVAPHGASPALLRAGDRGFAVRGQPVQVSRGAAGADDVAWTQGRLVFHDAAVREVAARLRRWYGVVLRVDDPALASRHLNAVFQGASRDEVVRVVAASLGGEVIQRGDTAFIVQPGAPSRLP